MMFLLGYVAGLITALVAYVIHTVIDHDRKDKPDPRLHGCLPRLTYDEREEAKRELVEHSPNCPRTQVWDGGVPCTCDYQERMEELDHGYFEDPNR